MTPFFGYLSDKTKSKLGRRRPWMLISAVPLALSMWFLLSIPEGLMGVKAFLAVLISFLLLDTCHFRHRHPLLCDDPGVDAGLHRTHVIDHRAGDFQPLWVILSALD